MHLSRRQFLETASTTAALAGLGSTAAAQEADDPLGVRGDFPVTAEGIYLDSAYITPSPRSVGEAVRPFIDAKARRPRSLSAMLEKKDAVRRQFAWLVNARPDEIGFLSATSDGENVVSNALDLRRGENVVLDDLHFETSYVLYRYLERTQGIELRMARARDGAVPPEAFAPLVDSQTRLISVTWVSHQNGFLHDIRGLADLAHAHGAYLYADAVQAAGMIPIDVQTTPVDCFTCGTYKWLLGGFGIAPFFVRGALLDRIRPDRRGFLQVDEELDNYHYTFFTSARKFEYATPAFAAFYELGAGLAYLERTGINRIWAHTVGLAHRLRAGLADQGFGLITPPGNQTSIVTFVNPTVPAEAARIVQAAGIRVTFREHGTRIRVSPALFNTAREIDRFLDAVQQLH